MAHGWKVGVAAVAAMVLAGATISQRVSAAPPKVVKAEPDNGATNVDPALREIRVTFDQDMSTGGFSWTGGGETYPKVRGRPQWVDKRTCVLLVELEPNHKYYVGVNSPSHKNFRSAGGEPAEWYRISFETGAGSGKVDEAKNWAHDVKAAADELRRAVDQRYSYRDLRGVDWDNRFGEYRERLLAAESPQQFATVAAELLGAAQDVHITIAADDQTMATFRRSIAANMNLRTLARVVPEWTQRSDCVWTGRFSDGIGYIQIGSWSRDQIDALEPAFEALDDFADTKAMIVDVRGNSGGSEPLAAQF
ncbi:MAG: Ig-like domain-containing protein, partial [Planctomycetes bacterium]|nr:Ig-like domain-containing protein [Planctomycetota bacterium]